MLTKALIAYRNQDWQQAENLFNTLKLISSNSLFYNLYIERIENFKLHPPEKDWDGVFTHKTK